jgi:hypothetical protein
MAAGRRHFALSVSVRQMPWSSGRSGTSAHDHGTEHLLVSPSAATGPADLLPRQYEPLALRTEASVAGPSAPRLGFHALQEPWTEPLSVEFLQLNTLF